MFQNAQHLTSDISKPQNTQEVFCGLHNLVIKFNFSTSLKELTFIGRQAKSMFTKESMTNIIY